MTEEIKFWLQKFVPKSRYDLNNWDVIIERRTEVAPDIFKYKCSFQNVYLDNNNQPVTYEEQHIIENKYYYDFTTNDDEGDGQYTYICDIYKEGSLI